MIFQEGSSGVLIRRRHWSAHRRGPFRFDSTFGKVDMVHFEKHIEKSRLVVIGEGLDGAGIERNAQSAQLRDS